MFVCCEYCVLSCRGLCDEPITCTEESYWLWFVVVCDQETSRMRRPWPALGRCATGGNKKTFYVIKLTFRIVHIFCLAISGFPHTVCKFSCRCCSESDITAVLGDRGLLTRLSDFTSWKTFVWSPFGGAVVTYCVFFWCICARFSFESRCGACSILATGNKDCNRICIPVSSCRHKGIDKFTLCAIISATLNGHASLSISMGRSSNVMQAIPQSVTVPCRRNHTDFIM